MVTLPSTGGQVFTNIKHEHGRVTEVLATDDASFMLGERFKLNGNSFLALLFFASLALGDETRIVLLGILAATVLHILRHGFLVELFVIAHHALSILNHSGEHGCQSVTFILVKTGKFSKAKNTTMLSIAIFVDVRLRETVVINTPALSHLISDK